MPNNMTIYKLTYGASGHAPEQTMFFKPEHYNDAIVRLSAAVTHTDHGTRNTSPMVHRYDTFRQRQNGAR